MPMELRIQLDDSQLQRARELTGLTDPQQLIPHVLARFVQMEAMARIARLRGTDPNASLPPKRTPGPQDGGTPSVD